MTQWPTPKEAASGIVCRPLFIPEGEEWESIVRGALSELLQKGAFVAEDGVSVDDTLATFNDALSKTLSAWLPCYQEYAIRVMSTMPGNLLGYWPLWDSAGASRADDVTPYHANGVVSDVTFGVSGNGDGNTAAFFDSADNISLAVSTLSQRINMNEGTALFWLRRDNWTEALARYYFDMGSDTSNRFLFRHDEAGRIIMSRAAGGATASFLYAVPSGTDWLCIVHTWSVSSSLMRLYFDGAYKAQYSGTLATISAAPNTILVGNGLRVWSGKIAHVALWDVVLSAEDILYVSAI